MQAVDMAVVRWTRRPLHDPAVTAAPAEGSGAQYATEWLCAERPGHPPLALIALRSGARQGWVVRGAAGRLAQAAMPTMRPASLLLALALAWGSVAWVPLAAAALAYAGWRASRRALLRHRLLGQIDAALHRNLTDTPEAMPPGEAPAYSSVRSLQISGNSTTSSILRR